jgi:hypothetical protein
MKVSTAFADYQTFVNASMDDVKKARGRRDLFRDAFCTESDVEEVVASGSLARGTQHHPINDVDTIIVFKQADHPDWGQPGTSAEDALAELGQRINDRLGAANGVFRKEVRLAKPRNHSVKCFLDDPENPNAFTVDAMPALRQTDGTLLIPEKLSQEWVLSNPEHLIELTKKAHADWNSFAPMVRLLKRWRRTCGTPVKSLVMEVLALDHLPREGDRATSLRKFFVAAAVAVQEGVRDPADLCGDIQPGLDTAALSEALDAAGDRAAEAIAAEKEDDDDAAVAIWADILKEGFPKPPRGGSGGGSSGGSGGSGGGGGAALPGVAAVPLLKPRPVRDAPQG